jgi:hypothetical protein
MHMGWRAAALVMVLAGVAAWASPAAAIVAPAIPSDFDGDGYADLAIGAPGEDVGGIEQAGTVTILRGGDRGLSGDGSQRWSQASPGVRGDAHRGDAFGSALATGDFDHDGYADLAIGAYGEWLGPVGRHAGGVNVLYGSRRGLTAEGDDLWMRANLPGDPDRRDILGWSLAVGDFDGDGYDDLAIGDPDHAVGRWATAGSVIVLRGSPDGLTAAGAREIDQSVLGEPPVADAHFGKPLDAGDLDGDGRDDLAIGVDGHLGDGRPGRVGIVYGTADGLDGTATQLISQGVDGVPGVADPEDAFGWDIAVGDFDADGYDDLAAGDQLEPPAPGPGEPAGVVVAIPGSAAGLDGGGATLLGVADVAAFGTANGSDAWPFSLAAGDLDRDGTADIVAGTMVNADNSVVALYGSPGGGVTGAGSSAWMPDTPGVPGSHDECFGVVLAVGAYGRSAAADVAIGNPCHMSGSAWNAGSVTVLYGRSSGLSATGAQLWSQASPGVPGSPGFADGFGSALTP